MSQKWSTLKECACSSFICLVCVRSRTNITYQRNVMTMHKIHRLFSYFSHMLMTKGCDHVRELDKIPARRATTAGGRGGFRHLGARSPPPLPPVSRPNQSSTPALAPLPLALRAQDTNDLPPSPTPLAPQVPGRATWLMTAIPSTFSSLYMYPYYVMLRDWISCCGRIRSWYDAL